MNQRSSLIGWLFAIGVLALMIDAAVETVWSGTRFGWADAGAIAICLVAILACSLGWLGSRLKPGAPRVASISVVALSVLVAVTAWLPGGTSDGLRLLGMSTSVLLSVVAAGATALAGVVLLRLQRVPAWAKAVIAALALYALAAFVLNVLRPAAFPLLFRGRSFWTSLPVWLQGATVGGLILVPLAAIVAAVQSVWNRQSGTGPRLAVRAAVFLAVGACTSMAALRAPAFPGVDASFGGISPGTGATPDTPRDVAARWAALTRGSAADQARRRSEVAEYLDRLFDDLQRAAGDLPRETFDPDAVVSRVGRDPQRLLEWLRDNTYWVPYRGALRGPLGVLMDRVGNDLDRALLLARLLHGAGVHVRLVHAQLDDVQARAVLANARPVPADREAMLQPPETRASRAPTAPARASQLPGAGAAWISSALREASQRRNEQGRRHLTEADARVGAQVPRLETALREAARPAAETGAREASARDHWWVQHEQNGAWIDLDPMTPGEREAAASKTYEADSDGTFPLDASLCHQLLIRVIVEQWKGSRLTTQKALEHTVRPYEVIGQPVTLRHAPYRWPGGLMADGDVSAAGPLGRAILDQREWTPILTVGNRRIVQDRFTTAGDVVRGGRGGLEGAGPGGVVGGLFGAMGGEEEAEPGQLTAEWIEYEVRAPDEPPRIERHEIFDLIGPAARAAKAHLKPSIGEADSLRRGLALLGEVDTLAQVADFSPLFYGDMACRQLLGNRAAWVEALREDDATRRRERILALEQPGGTMGPLYAYAFSRRVLSPVRRSVYLDSINLVNVRVRGQVNASGRLEWGALIDVLTNGVDVLPDPSRAPFGVRLAQGVADTVAEYLAVGAGEHAVSTTSVFAAAAAQGRGELLLRDAGDARWQHLPAAPDVRARVEGDLRSGFLVVLPDRPVDGRLGWWRVDPRDGSAIGVMDDGFHQGGTEKVKTDTVVDVEANAVTRPGYFSQNASDWAKVQAERLNIPIYSARYFQLFEEIVDFQCELKIWGLFGVV
jgi:hypothetical protein